MSLPTEIQIVPLDFDTIRTDLKRFLQNQNTLKDYNFEGSTLSMLIDVLAYDAYYHGWYTNFAVNEAFLHTAQIRNSVVAAARQIGYVPRSTTGAVALVDVTVNSLVSGEGSITIPKYTPFATTVSGQSYNFYTIQDYSMYVNGASSVVFSGMELYEGTKLTQTFTIASASNTGTSVRLLNQNVDTRTISVVVKPSENSPTSYAYISATSALEVNATSNVYFLFETNDGTYELQFGDGNLGRNLSVGQQVIATYLDSRGNAATGATTFRYAGSLLGLVSTTSNVSVALNNVNIPAFGGAAREDINSIKRNAPNVYQTQNRIVTAYDARSILLSEVSGIDSVTVWGGEDNDPPVYGKMFIAMKPVNAEQYGDTQKSYILKNVLRPKSMPTMGYELVDPDYVYIIVDSLVRYSPSSTSLNAEQIRQAVVSTVQLYAQDELGQFGSYFRYSQLLSHIDKADPSIQNNLTAVSLEKRLITNTAISTYTVKFGNPIYHPSENANVVSISSRVGTQLFSHPDEIGIVRRGCYIENEQDTINVYRDDDTGSRILTKTNVGSVNFEEGTIQLSRFNPTKITTTLINELRIRVIPRNSDFVPMREQILLIASDTITVRVIEDLINRTTTTFGKVTAGGRLGAGA